MLYSLLMESSPRPLRSGSGSPGLLLTSILLPLAFTSRAQRVDFHIFFNAKLNSALYPELNISRVLREA